MTSVFTLGLVLLAGTAQAQTADSLVLFRNVHVVDVALGDVLPDRSVLVRGPTIVRVTEGDIAVPEGATVVDGAGGYLVPGLYDMHVHTFESDELFLYLANGITTIRNLHGVAAHLRWADSVSSGAWAGPRMLTAGPIIDGDPPTRRTNHLVHTAAEARDTVRAHFEAGYQFIKIYDNVPADLYPVIIEAAAEVGLPVIGHLPTPVGIDGFVAMPGQHEIEHAEELFPYFNFRDTTGLGGFGRVLAERGVWLTPTIAVMSSAAAQAERGMAMLDSEEARYVSAEVMEMFRWRQTIDERATNPGAVRGFGRMTELARLITAVLHRAGVRLLLGTDAAVVALVPGFSVHEELAQLELTGLTRAEVLRVATINAAEYLNEADRAGAIRPGYRADLFLVAGNPLDDLAALERPRAVMAQGRLVLRAEMDRRLAAIAEGDR